MLFSDEKITVNMEDTNGTEEFDEDVLHMRQLLKTKLSDQDLSVPELPESRRRGHRGGSREAQPQRPAEVPQLR